MAWTGELRTAAAAFILLTLSLRYYHLSAGLAGASGWRSVALQVIATDSASHLSEEDKHALLVRAVADDSSNKAAELALLYSSYRTAATQAGNRQSAARLAAMLRRLPNDESIWPLRLRLRFNLLVTQLNYAAGFGRPAVRQVPADVAAGSDAAAARKALSDAAKQARHLLAFWQNRANQQALPELWRDSSAAVDAAAEAIEAEWGCRFTDRVNTGWRAAGSRDADRQVKKTLLARYEHACSLVGFAAGSAWRPQAERLRLYTDALDELEMATAAPNLRVWARTDPSLTDIHDIDGIRRASTAGQRIATADAFRLAGRFKQMVGDPVPADFLDLPPFAAQRAAIEQRGIHDAAQLRQQQLPDLVSELGITTAVAARWHAVADVYLRLRDLPPASTLSDAPGTLGGASARDQMTTALAFLLLTDNLDTVQAVRAALDPDSSRLRERLLDLGRGWAVVAPGQQEAGTWQAGFGID